MSSRCERCGSKEHTTDGHALAVQFGDFGPEPFAESRLVWSRAGALLEALRSREPELFACDIGVAVGDVVAKHGATDDDAASVLLVLAATLLLSTGHSKDTIRTVFEGALQLAPIANAALAKLDAQPRGRA